MFLSHRSYKQTFWHYICVFLALYSPFCVAENSSMEEVVVTANFRDQQLRLIPSSISVISEKTAKKRGAQHIDQLLGMAPNVNFSAGASRGRFFQIRGIGERSQFKDPLDSSVGLIVDGINLSGLGLAGTLADIDQLELLRGPQGTTFGSSAMAGLIVVKGNDVTDSFEGNVTAGLGNFGRWHSGLAISGPLTESLKGRLSIHQFRGDGYISNGHLQRDDTNGFNEFTLRGKLAWEPDRRSTVSLSYLLVDAKNGYDAFSLQNDRETASDEPGHDTQKTKGIAVNASHQFESLDLDIDAFWERTDLSYGFDWDWSSFSEVFWQGSEDNIRERESFGLDIRILSNQDFPAHWVVGAHIYNRDVSLQSTEYCCGYGEPPVFFSSDFETQRVALYGELNINLNDSISLSFGGRWENYDDEYRDSAAVDASPQGNLWGAKFSIEYILRESVLAYGSISRGYKTGGINGQAVSGASIASSQAINDFLTERLAFESESLVNYEVGMKGIFHNGGLIIDMSAFIMDRNDMQAKAWVLFPPANWQSYIDNVDRGKNFGVELSLVWDIYESLTLEAGAGYLDTALGELTVQDLDTGLPMLQRGRDQAHAPGYQFFLSLDYKISSDYLINLSFEAKDSFYFSNSHNIRSKSYELLHAAVQYRMDRLMLTFWGRNLIDTEYFVRGFYFGNNPANGWVNESFTQLGEPRTFGLTMEYQF